jgi:hypothetical protein
MVYSFHIQERVESAGNLRDVLDAAHDAFETVLVLIRSYQDSGGPFYGGLIMAAAAATDGRDAISAAPSLPRHSGDEPQLETSAANIGALDTAAAVAALSQVVARELHQAARKADATADWAACEAGARYADEVVALASGHAS